MITNNIKTAIIIKKVYDIIDAIFLPSEEKYSFIFIHLSYKINKNLLK